VLLVSASPPPAAYDGKKLVYKLRPNELSPDFYNEFYAPPTRAIADSLANYLDLRSPSLQIVRFQGASSPDYSLELALTDLYGDYTASPPVLRLSLTVTINDLRRPAPRVILSNRYAEAPALAPAPGEDRPATLVRQASEALAGIYPRILQDVEAATNARPR
jgi:hypothetical protein